MTPMRRHFHPARLTLVFLLVIPSWLAAQPYNPVIDVRHYEISLSLNDSTNKIEGQAAITLTFREKTTEFALDLTRRNSEGKGMTVTAIKEGSTPIHFTQQGEQLIIQTPGAPGGLHTYS